MTDLPEDVMQAARAAFVSCGFALSGDMRVRCEIVAAYAILADRKRRVGVKPLAWEPVEGRPPENPQWVAVGYSYNYTVFKAWWGAQNKWGYVGGGGFCHTAEEAFASCQADYERRIKAALEFTDEPDSFQARVAPWMHETFGPEISADRLERGDRLLEEVLELLQSDGYPAYRIARLSSYVYSRPAGEPAQEVGGVMVTLAAYCLARELDMHAAGETELARVWTKVEAIRAKQAAKPRGSALTIAAEPDPRLAAQEARKGER